MDEFEQTPGDGEGQGSLVCCSLWDGKVHGVGHDLMTKQTTKTILLKFSNVLT